MMLKVDEVKEGTATKAFDYSFKSSNNQTYRIILSLFENDTRFTINMTEKTEKICFSTEFTTQERVNQCSKGLCNRIDFFYSIILSVFEKNEADGKVTKDGIFQLILPYSIMNNKVENMIIDVGLVENDEIWRLKQTILDLKEELSRVTPENIYFRLNDKSIYIPKDQPIFKYKPKKTGNVVVHINVKDNSVGSLKFQVGNQHTLVNVLSNNNNGLRVQSTFFFTFLDGDTDIEVYSGNTGDFQIEFQMIITPTQEMTYNGGSFTKPMSGFYFLRK